jgi:hypothetical protein
MARCLVSATQVLDHVPSSPAESGCVPLRYCALNQAAPFRPRPDRLLIWIVSGSSGVTALAAFSTNITWWHRFSAPTGKDPLVLAFGLPRVERAYPKERERHGLVLSAPSASTPSKPAWPCSSTKARSCAATTSQAGSSSSGPATEPRWPPSTGTPDSRRGALARRPN